MLLMGVICVWCCSWRSCRNVIVSKSISIRISSAERIGNFHFWFASSSCFYCAAPKGFEGKSQRVVRASENKINFNFTSCLSLFFFLLALVRTGHAQPSQSLFAPFVRLYSLFDCFRRSLGFTIMFCWLSSTSSSTFYVPMMESQWNAMTTTRGFPLPLLRNLSIHLVVPRNTPSITPRDDAAEEMFFYLWKKKVFQGFIWRIFSGFKRISLQDNFFTIFFVVVAVALCQPSMKKVQCVLSSKNMTTTTTEERFSTL